MKSNGACKVRDYAKDCSVLKIRGPKAYREALGAHHPRGLGLL